MFECALSPYPLQLGACGIIQPLLALETTDISVLVI